MAVPGCHNRGMIRSLLPCLAVLALWPSAWGFPVPKGAGSSIAGTSWQGTNVWSQGQTETLTLTFLEGGKLTYDPGNGFLHYRATWEQTGNTVTWTVNDHATFKATLNVDKLEGSGSNNDKNNATLQFTRREAK